MGNFQIHARNNIFVRRNTAQSDIALWCLPGFADTVASFSTLFDTALTEEATVIAPDLPGFGASPRMDHPSNIAAYVETLAELIQLETPNARVGFVGHPVGSVVATEAARLQGSQCLGVFSIEGNITVEDAYFSGGATEFDSAIEFKEFFTSHIWQRGAEDPIFRNYHAGLSQADPEAMWIFGRDVKNYSQDDQPGHALLSLDCPTHYFWCADNTPEDTQVFIKKHNLPNTEVTGTSHWPMLDAADKVVESLQKFFKI